MLNTTSLCKIISITMWGNNARHSTAHHASLSNALCGHFQSIQALNKQQLTRDCKWSTTT